MVIGLAVASIEMVDTAVRLLSLTLMRMASFSRSAAGESGGGIHELVESTARWAWTKMEKMQPAGDLKLVDSTDDDFRPPFSLASQWRWLRRMIRLSRPSRLDHVRHFTSFHPLRRRDFGL